MNLSHANPRIALTPLSDVFCQSNSMEVAMYKFTRLETQMVTSFIRMWTPISCTFFTINHNKLILNSFIMYLNSNKFNCVI